MRAKSKREWGWFAAGAVVMLVVAAGVGVRILRYSVCRLAGGCI